MRQTFLRKMIALTERDPKVMLLTGDLGFGTFEEYAEKFPDNFINAGIAEQNMAGIAAGLAMDGHHVFVYSIGNFPTLRCLEQLRNDICYHDLPVTIVANGGGMAYGTLGMSHYATEDLSILRSLPNMTVTAPADPVEVEMCFDYLYCKHSPGYLRLCRGGEKMLHSRTDGFEFPALLPIFTDECADIAIFICGEIAGKSADILNLLSEAGVHADIYSCPVIKPLPDFSGFAAGKWKMLVTIEENNLPGGFGSGLAEYMAQYPAHPRLLRIGIPDRYCCMAGKHDFMQEHMGLSAGKIVEQIKANCLITPKTLL